LDVFHRFGELTVASTFRIPGLHALAQSLDMAFDVRLTWEEGKPPAPDVVLFRWPGRYGLTLGTLGPDWAFSTAQGAAYLVRRDGRDVRVHWAGSNSDVQVWDVFVRRVLPRIAIMFGRKAMHAAALGGERGAVLLMGSSHAGKSTLAAACVQWANCIPLSDDVSILPTAGSATVSPAASGLCLWPDSRAALGLADEHCRAMPGYEVAGGQGKIWFEPKLPVTPKTSPLNALVMLARSRDAKTARLERIDLAEGIVLASRQSIQFNPAAISPEHATRQLQDLACLMTQAPAYRLSYSTEYDGLRGAVDSLLELV
jgi:hypothetical protein